MMPLQLACRMFSHPNPFLADVVVLNALKHFHQVRFRDMLWVHLMM
jgi:hypothetical protein